MRSHPRIPVIFDTDIGTDIDDTWALAHLLRSPEIEPKLVLMAAGDMDFRTKVAARFLHIAGRVDVPIGRGVDAIPTPPHLQNQEPWIRGYELGQYPGEIAQDGVGRMIKIIEESAGPVTIIAAAPSANLAAALTRAPHIAAKCRLVAMYGSFDVGYSGSLPASAETNVREAPAACRAVLAASWQDVLITPLDTCNFAVLSGTNYHQIWCATADPMLRAVIENYCVFAPRVNWMHCDYFAVRSTVLFDCVAVYLGYSEELVETETLRFRVTDEGYTVRDDAGPFTARVALRWKNLPAFHRHLTARLLGVDSHISDSRDPAHATPCPEPGPTAIPDSLTP
jgi:inosine-uridine nucleoside N-ribohydrolase